MSILIVSRHPGTVEWLRDTYPLLETVPVLTGDVTDDDVKSKTVIGNLPLHLAASAATVYAVEFCAPPRGAEYGASEMEAAGARLRRYTVQRTEDFVRWIEYNVGTHEYPTAGITVDDDVEAEIIRSLPWEEKETA